MVIELKRYKGKPPIKILIDHSDYGRFSNHKWWINSLGYVHTRVDGKLLYLHRFIMNTPSGMVTDHINGNKLDNRKKNLRICSTRENVINSKLSRNSATGFRGVSFRVDRGKFRAYLMVNRKQVFLGYHDKFEDAVKARLLGEQQYFGKYAPTTIPPTKHLAAYRRDEHF